MAGFMKRNNGEQVETTETTQTSFIDKTAENWYCKNDTKKILFCNSIDDIINGKAESFDFVKREVSVKKEKDANGKDVERKKYILFTLKNDDKILVRFRGELK
jgi:hypothetical protein